MCVNKMPQSSNEGMPQQIHSKVTLCNSQITYKNNKHYILASIGLNMLKFMIVNL